MPTTRETSGLTTRLLVAHVRRRGGDAAVAAVLEHAALPHTLARLEDERAWVTYADKIALFAAAAEVLDDPDIGRHVGEALLHEQVGAGLRLLLGSLGGPEQVIERIPTTQVKFSTTATMAVGDQRPGGATVRYRLLPPHVPSRHDCLYTVGVLSQVPVLFGGAPATVEHPECQVLGASECRYEVRWTPRRRRLLTRRPGRNGPAATVEITALREQLDDLQRTVTDLVSTPDLDDLLRRIAERAGATVRGQRYLLAVRIAGEATPRIHADGLTEVQAVAWGVALLEGGDAERRPSAGRLLSEVRSAQHGYGWLAAYLPRGEAFLPGEQVQFDAYAGIAAAALDSATSLAEARTRGRTAQALLDLGHALAAETEEVRIADRVVEAVPSVVGARRSALLLWDDDAQELRVTAVVGYDERTAEVMALTMPIGAAAALVAMRADLLPRWFTDQADDAWIREVIDRFGAVGVAAAPVQARGELVGVVLASWTWRDQPPAHGHEQQVLVRLQGLADQAGLAIAGSRALGVARHQATHDDLTGLATRVLFGERVEQALADVRRSGRRIAVCFIDLDGFKAVNDRYGHAVGDRTLVEIGHRIRAGVRETDTVARLAGDEFGVLLRDLDDVHVAEEVADVLIGVLASPIVDGDVVVRVGASIGIAHGPDHGASTEELLRAADAAMYGAKADGGGGHGTATGAFEPGGPSGGHVGLRAVDEPPRTGT